MSSTINCVDSADPPSSAACGTTGADGGSASVTDLEPDTETCRVVLDPKRSQG
jgi:hypothetical protein